MTTATLAIAPQVNLTPNKITFPGSLFVLHQSFEPAGDQAQAIDKLSEGIDDGLSYQTLLGVTGSGKTYTMANVIARIGRPAIIMAPNKTLRPSSIRKCASFFRKTPLSTSSLTTITTSRKRM